MNGDAVQINARRWENLRQVIHKPPVPIAVGHGKTRYTHRLDQASTLSLDCLPKAAMPNTMPKTQTSDTQLNHGPSRLPKVFI